MAVMNHHISPCKTTPHLDPLLLYPTFLPNEEKGKHIFLANIFAKLALRQLSAHFCSLFAISASLERMSLNCAFVGVHGQQFGHACYTSLNPAGGHSDNWHAGQQLKYQGSQD
jgi:hypothetical protein